MSTDPYATTSTIKNILQHVISPKIVNDGSGGYQVKTDLVNIDNAVVSGDVSSSTNTTTGIIINAPMATSDHVQDITINVNSAPRWAISHKNPEFGTSSGSDFCIHGFDDAGVMQEALNINRTDFSTIVKGPLTVIGDTLTCYGIQAVSVHANAGASAPFVTVSQTLTARNVECTGNLQFPTGVFTATGTGNLNVTNGNYTFGTDPSLTTGYALFNNAQAGTISWTGNSVGTKTISGLNSSSIVTVTARNSGGLYGGGYFSVDTNTTDTLRVYTQNSGSYAFNYFIARF